MPFLCRRMLPALTMVLPVISFAQTAPTSRATRVTAAPVDTPTTSFTTDLGYLSTSGNTRISTVNVAERLVHTRGYWRFEQLFGVVYGKADGEENANLLRVGLDFPAARGALWYKRVLSESAYFLQTVEAIPNLEVTEDYRLNSESALVAPLSRRLALKLGYLVRFDNLPEPDFRTTDRIFTSGLPVSF